MTIDEAIENNKKLVNRLRRRGWIFDADTVQLGIEALELKRGLKGIAERGCAYRVAVLVQLPLPSEKEEVKE